MLVFFYQLFFLPDFYCMKRTLLHIAFWLSYMLLNVSIEYLWVSTAMPGYTTLELLGHLFLSNFASASVEILFAYYIMYIGYENLIDKSKSRIIAILQILLALACTIVLGRYISFYIHNYVVYDRKLAGEKLFDTGLILRYLIYLGFSAGPALSIRLFRKQLAAKEREHLLAEEKLSAELKLLRSQLHPHFLFNTLNNIYALARKKSDDAPDAILKLSGLLRSMLYETKEDTIPIDKEVNFIEDYIALEKVRYSNRLTLSLDKHIEDETRHITPFMLLPVVENAFKHGASETRNEAFIHISLLQQGSDFSFSVKNNFDTVQSAGNTGIGLQNLRRQLQLLYQDHSLDISSTNGIFHVSLHINLDSYGKA